MSSTLIDWLYIDNSGSAKSKQGALLLFPRMIDRWNVTSLIVSQWENYKVVIITDHPTEFANTIIEAPDTKWTDFELIPFPLIKYSDLIEINEALQNTEIDIIIFDDVRMLATITSALDCTKYISQYSPIKISNKDNSSIFLPKIIVLTTWGDTIDHLNIVTTKFSDLQLLTLDVISDIATIDWKFIKIPMSERQLQYYNQVRDRELKDTIDNTISHPMTRMLTLYTYPDNIMADTSTHKYICETDQSTLPDILNDNSWLFNVSPNASLVDIQRYNNAKNYLETLSDDGPKLLSVLDGIISNWPVKQLIVTRFNHRYGVDLIISFLQLMVLYKQNPYELNEIFHTSCTDDYEITINKFHKFNDCLSGILVTNLVPLIPLNNISIIHVVDSYSFLNLRMIIDRTHKRYLNREGLNLTIFSYLATHPSQKSSDEVLYENLITGISDSNRIYAGLFSAGNHVMFDPKYGLIVRQ